MIQAMQESNVKSKEEKLLLNKRGKNSDNTLCVYYAVLDELKNKPGDSENGYARYYKKNNPFSCRQGTCR
ncbi:MAG: hypothetical protein BMS9Abin36_1236 [Gammaproteobacteria bacterium]|nr:MAG: hypothetical protein BMS9Abin36_1236 [Gammaproteobacteria bacterium]